MPLDEPWWHSGCLCWEGQYWWETVGSRGKGSHPRLFGYGGGIKRCQWHYPGYWVSEKMKTNTTATKMSLAGSQTTMFPTEHRQCPQHRSNMLQKPVHLCLQQDRKEATLTPKTWPDIACFQLTRRDCCSCSNASFSLACCNVIT